MKSYKEYRDSVFLVTLNSIVCFLLAVVVIASFSSTRRALPLALMFLMFSWTHWILLRILVLVEKAIEKKEESDSNEYDDHK